MNITQLIYNNKKINLLVRDIESNNFIQNLLFAIKYLDEIDIKEAITKYNPTQNDLLTEKDLMEIEQKSNQFFEKIKEEKPLIVENLGFAPHILLNKQTATTNELSIINTKIDFNTKKITFYAQEHNVEEKNITIPFDIIKKTPDNKISTFYNLIPLINKYITVINDEMQEDQTEDEESFLANTTEETKDFIIQFNLAGFTDDDLSDTIKNYLTNNNQVYNFKALAEEQKELIEQFYDGKANDDDFDFPAEAIVKDPEAIIIQDITPEIEKQIKTKDFSKYAETLLTTLNPNMIFDDGRNPLTAIIKAKKPYTDQDFSVISKFIEKGFKIQNLHIGSRLFDHIYKYYSKNNKKDFFLKNIWGIPQNPYAALSLATTFKKEIFLEFHKADFKYYNTENDTNIITDLYLYKSSKNNPFKKYCSETIEYDPLRTEKAFNEFFEIIKIIIKDHGLEEKHIKTLLDDEVQNGLKSHFLNDGEIFMNKTLINKSTLEIVDNFEKKMNTIAQELLFFFTDSIIPQNTKKAPLWKI